MDPQAAWDQLLAAYAAGDWDRIRETATDLLGWLDRDGFPPTINPQTPDLGSEWNRVLVRAACVHALEVVECPWCIQA